MDRIRWSNALDRTGIGGLMHGRLHFATGALHSVELPSNISDKTADQEPAYHQEESCKDVPRHVRSDRG